MNTGIFFLNTHRFNKAEYIPELNMTFKSDSKFPRGVGHTQVCSRGRLAR